MPPPAPLTWQRSLVVTGSVVVTIAALYFARAVLIPLVLAILLTFVLMPLVNVLQHRGLGRVSASVFAVLFACLVVSAVGVAVFAQVEGLAGEIPQHKESIIRKLLDLKESGRGSWWEAIYDTLNEIVERVRGTDTAQPPREVVLAVPEASTYWELFQRAVAPLLDFLVHAGLVLILVIFMLIHREDLRNRLIRLSGTRYLTTMTRALDDASSRISRFLAMQLVTNTVFGAAVGLGLFLIEVPYAFLWGFLAGLFRYIPYIGVWIAALLPASLSLAVFPGWQPLMWVLALFLALEIAVANFLEPWLYGRSIGVSEVALITAAVFWAWLWGPIGLLLCTPLTACLAVVGRYIPNFEFLHILLGDQPALETSVSFYQRLLAHDLDEASDIVESYLKDAPPEKAYDELLLPALALAKGHHQSGQLSRKDLRYICQAIYDLATDNVAPQLHAQQKEAGTASEDKLGHPSCHVVLVGCPARDEADHAALHLLAQLVDHGNCRFEVVGPRTKPADIADRLRDAEASAVCIMALPPGGLTETRALCKKLRSQFARLKIFVGWWGRDVLPARARLADHAEDVVPTLLELRQRLKEVLATPIKEELPEPAATP